MEGRVVKRGIDWSVAGLVISLVVFGLIMIADISLVEAETYFGDRFYFLKHQLIWVCLGGILAFLASHFNYRWLKRFSRPIFIFSIITLLLVFLPGIGITAYGARRWISLGFTIFQPVELLKLSSIIYFSTLLSEEERRPLWQQMAVLALPVTLLLLEPDFSSTALIIALVASLWFLAKENLISLFLIGILGLILGGILILSSPYRKERILGFIDPFYDPQGRSYHAYQLALTLGSGGWFGKGMGNSRQKYQYLPEATTDSIIALAGEEFGFVGISLFLIVFSLLLHRCLRIARLAPDPFGQFLAAGIAALIALQGIINLGAVAIALPLTGMPFPFVSYGGSSIIVLSLAVGILLNVSRYCKTD